MRIVMWAVLACNVPYAVWDIAAPEIVNVCRASSEGAQDRGRAFVTLTGTDEALACASAALDRAAIAADARRAKSH